ncbi:OsmC family protein [Amylibacter sp. SFDW26]|uniref:OsmC family protein n=1 Tax=Amylibacter sp. SFDW26 TaxID=2652722 RepID=UPI0012616690|nr:OsmC family protein [Amylibacter sp. SFDW26]KAB7615293.1 OsmC family protein [Amylibacter sp. SFDW26]
MNNAHSYTSLVRWTGNTGTGTKTYHGYERTWDVAVPGKKIINCSNDPLLGGDSAKMNPEDLMLSALSSCHMLWYLHLASSAKITVLSYQDTPVGTGEVMPDGSGRFLKAVLKPVITVETGNDLQKAHAIHGDIHQYCFIARSVNFPVTYEPVITEA